MRPYFAENGITLYQGDALEVLRTLPAESVNTCVTSPPYWGLRDYGVDGQLGLEPTPAEYVAKLVDIFREVRRVLRNDGTLWLNLGDCYASAWACSRRNVVGNGSPDKGTARPDRLSDGLKEKDLVGIPWRVAFALQADGWYLRSDIVWHKPNPMPESVTDRPTKAHEYLFLLSKRAEYHYDADAIREEYVSEQRDDLLPRPEKATGPNFRNGNSQWETGLKDARLHSGRNKRTVWTVNPRPYPGAHFATFPPDLIRPCIRAGAPAGGVVLDPFFGAGTTGVVCQEQHVRCVGIELNPDYCKLAKDRLAQGVLNFAPARDPYDCHRGRKGSPKWLLDLVSPKAATDAGEGESSASSPKLSTRRSTRRAPAPPGESCSQAKVFPQGNVDGA